MDSTSTFRCTTVTESYIASKDKCFILSMVICNSGILSVFCYRIVTGFLPSLNYSKPIVVCVIHLVGWYSITFFILYNVSRGYESLPKAYDNTKVERSSKVSSQK